MNKKILLCSDSFKGTLSSKEIVDIAQNVVSKNFKNEIELSSFLIADGGEGTLEAFANILNGEYTFVDTIDAEFNKINVPYLYCNESKEAYIEVSKIIGLPNIKNIVSKLKRTTKGIGVVIKDSIKRGAKTIYICLGGTSTNDFGIGMLEELGLKTNIKNLTGNNLVDIKEFDDSELNNTIKEIKFIGLSDVKNPLIGEKGATHIFGPQKGYGDKELEYLEEGMININNLVKLKKHIDLSTIFGAGAAGGIGGAIVSFLNGTLESGIETLLNKINFKEVCKEVDYVITGEGKFDDQSLNGKVISGILSSVDNKKVIIICGVNKIENSNLMIFETSKGEKDFEYIKLHAKKMYEETFKETLKLITNIK